MENFTMLRIFLTATLSGGCVFLVNSLSGLVLTSIPDCSTAVAIGKAAGWFSPQPRSPASKGWFSTYDGNIVGGLLQGVAMALTGACPGTVIVQAATGIKAGYVTIAGGLLGGLVYKTFGPRIARQARAQQATTSPSTGAKPAGPATLASFFNLSIPSTAAMVLLTGCGIVALLPKDAPVPPALVQPIQAGLLIGFTQLLSILLRKKTMGVSTCYEDMWQLASGATDSVIFAAGVFSGALALARLANFPAGVGASDVSALGSFLGGVIGIFGARLAGGCTSGHGLSGVPTLGLASIITTACMFIGGIPVALALK
jgi:uncharacterized membrane protein YedE/YeeE